MVEWLEEFAYGAEGPWFESLSEQWLENSVVFSKWGPDFFRAEKFYAVIKVEEIGTILHMVKP